MNWIKTEDKHFVKITTHEDGSWEWVENDCCPNEPFLVGLWTRNIKTDTYQFESFLVVLTESGLQEYNSYDTQPLELGMFVPCDLEGNVLEEPNDFIKYQVYNYIDNAKPSWLQKCSTYQTAKERVIFEVDEYNKEILLNVVEADLIIEELFGLNNGTFELTLTESKANEIGL